MKKYYRLLFFMFFLLSACESSYSPQQTVKSFYFWKNTLTINDLQNPIVKDFSQKKNLQRLYLRVMDVDWAATEGGAFPRVVTTIEAAALTGQY